MGLGLNMGLQLVPALRLVCQCPVCGQPRDEENAHDTAVTATIFGQKAYAICCCCGQEVYGNKDKNYRARWRRWAAKHSRKEKA